MRASQSFPTNFLSIKPHCIWGLLSKALEFEDSEACQSRACLPLKIVIYSVRTLRNFLPSLLFLPPFTKEKDHSPCRLNFIRFKYQNAATRKYQLYFWLPIGGRKVNSGEKEVIKKLSQMIF
jgi:hypothetical protein